MKWRNVYILISKHFLIILEAKAHHAVHFYVLFIQQGHENAHQEGKDMNRYKDITPVLVLFFRHITQLVLKSPSIFAPCTFFFATSHLMPFLHRLGCSFPQFHVYSQTPMFSETFLRKARVSRTLSLLILLGIAFKRDAKERLKPTLLAYFQS